MQIVRRSFVPLSPHRNTTHPWCQPICLIQASTDIHTPNPPPPSEQCHFFHRPYKCHHFQRANPTPQLPRKLDSAVIGCTYYYGLQTGNVPTTESALPPHHHATLRCTCVKSSAHPPRLPPSPLPPLPLAPPPPPASFPPSSSEDEKGVPDPRLRFQREGG